MAPAIRKVNEGTCFKEGERRVPGVRKEKEGRGSRAPGVRRGEEGRRV